MQPRSGGRILIESLRQHGVKKVFCVPGESYLDALDALHDATDIRNITCRQEGGAAFMAEAYAKLTGHAGVCFVTRGPGACNAAIGVHTAMQDSTPFILLVGQVARDQKGREAFQEIEYRDMFKPPITKWVVEIEKASDIPQVMAEAFERATSGRPGPVVIALPEDMLREESDAPIPPIKKPPHFAPRASDIKSMIALLDQAKKPLAVVGGGSWDDPSIQAFQNFCEKHHIPVATGFRRQDAFANSHGAYVGSLGTTVNPQLIDMVKESDLILAVGTRLGEIVSQGYTLFTPPKIKQKLIHIYPDAAEFNKVYTADIALHATVKDFVTALDMIPADHAPFGDATWMQTGHAHYRAWSTLPTSTKYEPDMDGIYQILLNHLPDDAIITTDAGNFSGWAQRYIRYDRPRRLLAPTAGAMGYGVPSAVAASLRYPDRVVIGLMGDGGFMMTGQELATAVHEKANPIWIVCNNNMYGTIRMHQEIHYPDRISATHLTNPDFAKLAESYGITNFTITKTADFLPAIQSAMASKKPALIEIRMNPEQLTTGKSLSEI